MLDAIITSTSGDKHLLPATVELMATRELIGLEYDQPSVDKLVEEVPYYSRFELAPGLVPGWDDKPYQNVSQATVYLFAGKNLPDDKVYEIVETIYANLQEAAKEVPYLEYTAENPEIRNNL